MKKYFGTDGIRGIANEGVMTPEVALKLGMATGTLFKNGYHKHKVVIGKDARLSGYLIEPALTAGFISVGIDVLLVGPMPTPAVAMLTKSLRADLGIVISASHNPFQYNGIKVFTSQGLKIPPELEKEIEELIESYPNNISFSSPQNLGKAIRLNDAPGRYIEFTKNTFPKGKTLNGLKIVIDSANGAAYHIVKNVFWELGAEVIQIGDKPNGLNINDGCGSMHPQLARDTVLEHKADLGVVLDGDADRVILIDEKGNIIDGDKILATIALHMKQQGNLPKDTIVATHMSNLGLEKYLARHNINLLRTDIGDKYVSRAMYDGGYTLGGEQSGHIILSDFGLTGDGIIAALQILAHFIESKDTTISSLCNKYDTVPQKLVNITYDSTCSISSNELNTLTQKFQNKLTDVGRVLIRKSGTEPVVRVMVEHESKEVIDSMLDDIKLELNKLFVQAKSNTILDS